MSSFSTPVIGLKEFERFAQNFEKMTKDKCEDLVDILAQKGAEVAKREFAQVIYDGDHAEDVFVKKNGPGKCDIVAEGNAVLFIEYGAGVHHNGAGAYPGELPEGLLGIGEFGSGKGKNDYWFYSGQPGTAGGALAHGHPNSTITHGNPPNACMYKTRQEVIEIIPETAKRVFK